MKRVGLRSSKLWRYRYVVYVAAMAFYGYKAYQMRCNPQPVVQAPKAQDGSELITLPDGQKARLYDVDAFMKLHGQKPGKAKGAKVSPVQLAPGDAPPSPAKAPAPSQAAPE